MISQQLRAWGVLDDNLLNIVADIDRADFVPNGYEQLAYADTQIPLAHNQIMLEPKVQARIVQALELSSESKVLEIGTGTGYMTALLAKSAKTVLSIDIFSDFSQLAAKKLAQYQIENVELLTEDASKADASMLNQKFDTIVISSAFAEQPNYLLDCLAEEGKLFCFIGRLPVMAATVFTKEAGNSLKDNIIFETVVPFLINSSKNEQFQF